ncbi:urea ABC transporter substrate-binding protein [Paraburkholderia sp. SIMBA_009]|uniref:Amino acid/amide ABC transporter substrate-binding protein, HAAT family n=1 Tax=Paraburkholderia tropica TaxID=92647 RepID=A0AAQ1GNK5_9BURK|nr:urea ABC transporter substrate-binding protein [Paraburkholderia tropica]QNB17377.1 urea ABC transporter substrate-binding protein [Paraburkholderia tropica]RQN36221.1 urea ABC transporter substrate-binding protein [Paraburkholderia tropica]SEK14097.1 amino acid/amide ABC transporter substrate-binding protein, HAAT family [Paraburkholderia tropica]
MTADRRTFLKSALASAAAAAFPAVATLASRSAAAATEPIKVGILHSLTGTMAIAEAHIVDAEKMAIDELNASGGVLGRPIQTVVEDGASDWPTFAEKAQKLLESDRVSVIFGCHTSASRKAVLPVMERYNGLLYYPCYYEGLEMSKNIMYTGQEATQSVIPAIGWLAKNKGKKFFLIGSDYVWPRTINRIAHPVVAKAGGTIVGEDYFPLGAMEFSSVIAKIKAAKPDVILSTVVGGSNVALFKQLNSAGINGHNQAIMALAVSEEEAYGIGSDNLVGVLSCMGYFQSIDTPGNKAFVSAFKKRYGQNRVLGDTMEASYTSVHLWKLAAEKAKSLQVENVVAASSGLEWDAPEGKVRFHTSNHHLWKHARIGAFRADGQVDILYESPLIEPNPFPKL